MTAIEKPNAEVSLWQPQDWGSIYADSDL